MAYLNNKKAYFDYEILEKFSAGIVLEGWEVKSIRSSMGNLKGSFVKIDKTNNVFLSGMHISRWKTQADSQYIEETRDRKLLLKKSEINKLNQFRNNSGVTIVPLKIYSDKNLLKVEIGVARGKKKYDKREALKKKDIQRDIKSKGNVW